MEGVHNHYEKYITRVVGASRKRPHLDVHTEYLQLICEVDGIVFDEIPIVEREKVYEVPNKQAIEALLEGLE